jgi:hypothetical protein
VVPHPDCSPVLCGEQNGGGHALLPLRPLPEVALPGGQKVVPHLPRESIVPTEYMAYTCELYIGREFKL